MLPTTDAGAAPARFAADRLLEAWALYRIGIAGALLWLIHSPWRPPDIGTEALTWLTPVLLGYTLAGAILLAANRSRLFGVLALVTTHLLCDLAVAAVATYLSGGLAGGLGTLFVLPVAMGALFLPRSAAPLPAALASLLLLTIEWRLNQDDASHVGAWAQAGILGGLLFMVALLAHTVAQRARIDEQIARLASTSLGQMRALAAEAVERMHAAVVVTDSRGTVLLRNAASIGLLSHEHDRRPLAQREPALWAAARAFQAGPENAIFRPVALSNGRMVWPQFVHLPGEPPLLLIVVDDPEHIARQTQQARLAAVGQLTAGVAHDIRNPLAALSNAAQLLRDAPPEEHTTLLAMIQRQTRRLNRVIERIYDLARPIQPRPEPVAVAAFLHEWLQDYRPPREHSLPAVDTALDETGPAALVDPDHLAECLNNLMDNALHHARPPRGSRLRLLLACGPHADGRVWIGVADNGTNPLPAGAESQFEAFHGEGKLGLGLTLCRELMSANDGEIVFGAPPEGTATPGTQALLRLPAARGARA